MKSQFKINGLRPLTSPCSFCLPQKSQQKKSTPMPSPLRGFPSQRRAFAVGQKLIALRQFFQPDRKTSTLLLRRQQGGCISKKEVETYTNPNAKPATS
jgi:hypothetical protein